MGRFQTYFEQVPVEIVKKIANLQIAHAGETLKTPRERTKARVERTIPESKISSTGAQHFEWASAFLSAVAETDPAKAERAIHELEAAIEKRLSETPAPHGAEQEEITSVRDVIAKWHQSPSGPIQRRARRARKYIGSKRKTARGSVRQE
jgi:hypothetical protein